MGSRTNMVSRKNAPVINITQSQVSIDFVKKCDDHKLCAMSSFNWFFVYRLENSKFKHSQRICP
ncbi:hypothetical protein GW17_00059715 [Ensete ventricosum]|nr:hypothetical protein GW17_00059715 [Ensete ventricosum]